MLHRMVQQLGTGRDTSELRNQCQHQLQVVDELRGKIHAQVCVYLHTVCKARSPAFLCAFTWAMPLMHEGFIFRVL